MSDYDYVIEERQVKEGINLCIKKVKVLLDHALRLTIDAFENSHALGLYTFAIEEYGKALLLKESLSTSTNGKCIVSKQLFGLGGATSHKWKFDTATKELPGACKDINIGLVFEGKDTYLISLNSAEEGFVLEHGKETALDVLLKSIDFDVRKRCFYVAWNEKRNQWNLEVGIEKDKLMNAIIRFKEHLQGFESVG